MNKIIILIVFIGFTACNINKDSLQTFEQNHSVVIMLDKGCGKIYGISFPTGLIMKNKSICKKSFVTIDYEYNPYSKGVGEDVYVSEKEEFVEIKNNQKKTINPFGTNCYVIYSWHRLDSTKAIQQQFKPYVEKMLRLEKDTLHIGTVVEFKKKHKELFESLTKNDSISIRLLNSNSKSGLGERIVVPVNW